MNIKSQQTVKVLCCALALTLHYSDVMNCHELLSATGKAKEIPQKLSSTFSCGLQWQDHCGRSICVFSAHLSWVEVLGLVLLSAWPLAPLNSGSSTTTWGFSRKHQPLWTPMWSLLSCMTTVLNAPSGPGCFWEWGALELWNYLRMTDHVGHLWKYCSYTVINLNFKHWLVCFVVCSYSNFYTMGN